MNKLNFHDFYNYLWEDESLIYIISTRFLEEEEDFIRNLTLEIYRQYELRPDVSLPFIKKMVEILFSSLAIFEPNVKAIKPIPDNSNTVF